MDRVRLDIVRHSSRLYERHDLGADEQRFGVGDCRKISGQGGKADHACFFGHTADTGGTVFVTSPAVLLARLTPGWANTLFWVIVILAYYFLATLLSIDKLIGKLYPIFGIVLILMAVLIMIGLCAGGYTVSELKFANLHPTGKPVFSYMFITVACGVYVGGLQLLHSDGGREFSDQLSHCLSDRALLCGSAFYTIFREMREGKTGHETQNSLIC